ncbi:MAG: signal transduction histidine kinase [Enterobacterales bacterium]|jgi:signal transduction histidine kinase
MKLSLYQRLALTTSIVFIAMVSIIFWWMQNLEINSRFKAEQELHRDLATHLVADNPLLQEGALDKVALENLFHSMMILGPSFEFYVLDATGNVKTYSAKPGLVVRNNVDLKSIKKMVNGQSHFPLYGEDPRSLDGHKIFSVAPLIKDNQLRGYLYVIIGGQIYDSVFQRILTNKNLQLSLIVAGATLLFLLVSLLLTFRIFVSPLRRLTSEVNAIRKKGFEQKLVGLTNWESYHGEVQDLGYAFNAMINQINTQMTQLKAVDSQRRELLTHISHDLRTPLASLQGYIETIDLKSDSLSEEQQNIFLKRALKNAQQLKHLVDQIFELAHLESGQVAIQLEQFSLTEMLYDLRDKFAITATKKNISINIDCPESSLHIKTDIGKLERILSNLIENALRHTQVDGTIILGVTAVDNQHGWVVSVEDNGDGIPEDDIPYIFDARFRAKNATEGKNENTGLGLAITRKLLDVLGTDIKVKSALGEGTRFSFVLE